MSVEGMVEVAIVWAVASWAVALGMLATWALMRRRDR